MQIVMVASGYAGANGLSKVMQTFV